MEERVEIISEIEGRGFEIIQLEEKKRMKKDKKSLNDLWNFIKIKNIRIIGISEGEKMEK